jgi:hypothetical protein
MVVASQVNLLNRLDLGGIDVLMSLEFSAESETGIEPDALPIGEAMRAWGKNCVEFKLPRVERPRSAVVSGSDALSVSPSFYQFD